MTPYSADAMGEIPSIRSYFYIGGTYVESDTGHRLHNQMYVERLQPVTGEARDNPIVLIHGQAQSGTVGLLGLASSSL
jgi:hypothetical protein